MLHKANQPPPTLQPAEKVANEPVPINLPTAVAPVAVPAPRQQPDFPSMAVAPHSNQNPVFSGNFFTLNESSKNFFITVENSQGVFLEYLLLPILTKSSNNK